MISVCIPVKNRANNLMYCLQALQKLEGDFEIVIADNESDDIDYGKLPESLILPHPVTVKRWSGDWSIGRAKNIAAEHASGSILFFLDADLIVSQEVINKIKMVLSAGLVYAPIMWMQGTEVHDGEYAIHSFGQVALWKKQWEAHRWEEWTSYGGEDNLFVEPYKNDGTLIRDCPNGFVHQWHSHEVRNKYYKDASETHLNIERERRNNAK